MYGLYRKKDEGGKDANYIIYLSKARHVHFFFAYPTLQICAVELQWKCIKKTVILKNYSFLLLTFVPCIFHSLKIVVFTF